MCQFKCILESSGKGWVLHNLIAGLRHKASTLKKKILPKKKRTLAKSLSFDNLEASLSVGDYVKVRPKEELLELMGYKRYKCPIMREMYGHSGKTFKVLKEVHYFYDEVKERLCNCEDIYLLEGSNCTSAGISLPEPCDLNCFFFWHKDWVVKV
jgi:hypothetical protein